MGSKRYFGKGLFLDLDGTIIKTKSGLEFPVDVNDWEFIPGVLKVIKFYVDEGYIPCIVTNQGGISLGYVTHEEIKNKLKIITSEVEQYIGTDVSTMYSSYMEGFDRKPNPGMAYCLARELQLILKDSIMVGDAPSDKEFAINAGIGEFIHINDFLDLKNKGEKLNELW